MLINVQQDRFESSASAILRAAQWLISAIILILCGNFVFPIAQLYKIVLFLTYFLKSTHIITYKRTFIMVTFDTGTNFPAVSWNSLLAVAIMNIRYR